MVSSQREGGSTVFLDETPNGILRCGSTVVLLTDPVAPDTLHRVFGYQALGYGAGSKGCLPFRHKAIAGVLLGT